MAMKHLMGKDLTGQQRRPLGRDDMVRNDEGGFVFPIDDWGRLDRFLLMGTEGGSYYVGEQKLTLSQIDAVMRCMGGDGQRVINRTVELSQSGRAAKNDYALFVLAMMMTCGKEEDKRQVAEALPLVARTGTHLLHFASFMASQRGWGRAAQRAIERWYQTRTPEELAFQAAKYRTRDGMSQCDLIRLVHPKPQNQGYSEVFRWITQDYPTDRPVWPFTSCFGRLRRARDEAEALAVLRDYAQYVEMLQQQTTWDGPRRKTFPSLTWEMTPSECRGPAFWTFMVPRLPMTALIRQLPTLTRLGVLANEELQADVLRRLRDPAAYKAARIHPMQMLMAATFYRGDERRPPIPAIQDALEDGFRLAFASQPRTGARLLIGVDVSGSMTLHPAVPYHHHRPGQTAAAPGLTLSSADVASALALVLSERAGFGSATVCGFADTIHPVSDLKNKTLGQCRTMLVPSIPRATDCALPMLYATRERIPVDCFVILTDGQTYAGDLHPYQALRRYRKALGIPARMVNVALGHEFTVADPEDPKCLDIVGYDPTVPNLIEQFICPNPPKEGR